VEMPCAEGTTGVEFILLKDSYEGGRMVDFGKMVGKKQGLDACNLMELFNSPDRQASHTTLLLRLSMGLVDLIIERSNL